MPQYCSGPRCNAMLGVSPRGEAIARGLGVIVTDNLAGAYAFTYPECFCSWRCLRLWSAQNERAATRHATREAAAWQEREVSI